MSEVATSSMHAHRCEVCLRGGKNTIWVHPEACRGVVASHTCPECGHVEWKQFLVEAGRLPQVTNAQGKINFETLLGYIMLAVGLALLGYGAFLYVKKVRAGKTNEEI
jgi:predicted RNA-binding Zn-ribbon protein involved in translation (DUF1610 family)